ncbi:phage baseplate plug family protein [Anaerosolibacter sp.]|uniref:phage baseplate plug family protein n=1 Tax=Anaerosolibacter sp. TaxID=1872527 RepID=UPI0039EFFBFC
MIEIIVPDDNDFIVNTALEGKNYGLHFSWNASGKFWTIGIQDDSQNIIVSGIKMVPNYPLLQQFRVSSLPPGEFMAVSETLERIGRYDFVNGSAALVYIESGEFDAVLS